jgi:ABC-type glycerol-3-phosphate transport system substrate-binding protein
MKISSFLILALLLIPSEAWAQARKPTTIAELASYRGADREALLHAGAKTEGKVIWYTSLAGDSYKELVKAFEIKYPGVKVDSYRAAGADLVVRLQEEAKARRNIADTIETTEGSLIFLREDKLLRPYDSPYLDKYPEDGKERADKNLVYWALARESYIGLPTTRRSCQKTPCRKISTASCTRSSKARWASASARPATKSSAP